MKISGFLKQSLIDYPGNIASVVFTSGCNFRCFYCHNPELVLPELIQQNPILDTDDILNYLENNKQLLDAVVITGGEPSIHKDLPDFIKQIKQLGLLVKLDTNGTNPKMITKLIKNNLVDYIAMDIKAKLTLRKYGEIVGSEFSFTNMDRVLESVKLIQQSTVKYEFRTTIVKPNHTVEDIMEISNAISGNYYLQEYNDQKTLKNNLGKSCFSETELASILDTKNELVNIQLRN